MLYDVVVTQNAEKDLEDIYDYVVENDGIAKAEDLLEAILKNTENLALFPEKGSIPKELQELGIQEYRQIFFKPYQIIYQLINKQVVIFIITDGRRDMQAQLVRRLLLK